MYRIVYRDMKMANVVLDTRGYAKICDFGMSIPLPSATSFATTICGTPEYMAPEMLKNGGYAQGVDWWALGVLLYEMLMGHAPFQGDSEEEIMRQIIRGITDDAFHAHGPKRKGAPPGALWPHLVRNLCALNPRERLDNA